MGTFNIFSQSNTDILDALHKSLAIIEFDPKGNILSANENFCAALGYEAADIIGQHHQMFVDREEVASAEYEAFWRRLAGGEYDSGEYKRFTKDGQEIWIQATYNPIMGKNGKVYKVVKFASDTTAAKLESAEDKGKIEAVSRAQAMIEFELDGTIIHANENFCAAMGYDLSQIVGKHHSMFVDRDFVNTDEYRDFWARLASGEFIAEEFKRFGNRGKEIWIQASYNPIFDMSGNVMKVVKFATDITGRVHAVDEIGNGLHRLAEGDLSKEIVEPFIPSLDKLREDFNSSLVNLRKALSQIGENADALQTGSAEIRAASDDLSQRTETQAASVEETASAVQEITVAVKGSTTRAEEAGALVQSTKTDAEKSGQVVDRAVAAMGEIKSSSDQIASIIGVIDDIAFQTNLLALNAGVEAARAGEAGKGFSVVAQEVRELAQRSATAAKEIKDLITTSGNQVQTGVDLVAETGKTLKAIVISVLEVNEHVSAIVSAAREQSETLQGVNDTINSIDQATQQNAAMAEEATTLSHSLATESGALAELLGQFKLSGSQTVQMAPIAAQQRAATEVPNATQFASHGNAALAVDEWS